MRTIKRSKPESNAPLAFAPTRTTILPLDLTTLGEDLARLPYTLQQFTHSWNPANPFEAALIQRLAELQLRLDRCVRIETGLLEAEMPPITSDDSRATISAAMADAFTFQEAHLQHLSRYEANLSRAFDRTLKQLLAAQKTRPKPDPSIPRPAKRTQCPLKTKSHPRSPGPPKTAARARSSPSRSANPAKSTSSGNGPTAATNLTPSTGLPNRKKETTKPDKHPSQRRPTPGPHALSASA